MRIIVILLGLLLLFSGCAKPGASAPVTEEASTSVTGSQEQAFSCDALFFGDSITADSNFKDFFPDLSIVNLGVYGDTLEDLLRRVPAVKAERPARIFLMGGINSLRPDNVPECLEEYEALLNALLAACPDAELIVQSVLPVGREIGTAPSVNEAVRRFNAGIKALAEERGLSWVDLYSVYERNGELNPALTRDGVHLNFNAYGPWAESIAGLIRIRD